MLARTYDHEAAGLQHYDDMLTLTGRQYRFTGGGLSLGVVLGMLDARTGRLPIGLVDPRNVYWAETLYYDANRRTIDVYDQDRWSAFVETYAAGGWILGLVQGVGGTTLMAVGGIASAIFGGFRFFLVPAILFGFTGLVIYAFVGAALVSAAARYLPSLIGGLVAWGSLCGVIALERHLRCNRINRGLEAIIADQLYPVFD